MTYTHIHTHERVHTHTVLTRHAMEKGVEEGVGEGVVSEKVRGEVHLWSGG